MITFYFWIKSIKTGSMFYAGVTALAYFYMVAAWGALLATCHNVLLAASSLTVALIGSQEDMPLLPTCSLCTCSP